MDILISLLGTFFKTIGLVLFTILTYFILQHWFICRRNRLALDKYLELKAWAENYGYIIETGSTELSKKWLALKGDIYFFTSEYNRALRCTRLQDAESVARYCELCSYKIEKYSNSPEDHYV
jgi:hypothetical protein